MIWYILEEPGIYSVFSGNLSVFPVFPFSLIVLCSSTYKPNTGYQPLPVMYWQTWMLEKMNARPWAMKWANILTDLLALCLFASNSATSYNESADCSCLSVDRPYRMWRVDRQRYCSDMWLCAALPLPPENSTIMMGMRLVRLLLDFSSQPTGNQCMRSAVEDVRWC